MLPTIYEYPEPSFTATPKSHQFALNRQSGQFRTNQMSTCGWLQSRTIPSGANVPGKSGKSSDTTVNAGYPHADTVSTVTMTLPLLAETSVIPRWYRETVGVKFIHRLVGRKEIIHPQIVCLVFDAPPIHDGRNPVRSEHLSTLIGSNPSPVN